MNEILISVLLAGLGAQFLKALIFWRRHGSLGWHDIVVTGGMPSSHAAFVVSLVTIIYLKEGISTGFSISLVLALIVLVDAFNVRRSVGEEGMVIDRILKRIRLKTRMHYALGHTPAQVLAGALFGLLVALLVHYA